MSEEVKIDPIPYQAKSDAADLDHGVEFQVEIDKFEEDQSIDVNFDNRTTRTLRFVSTSDDPRGYIVAVDHPRVVGNVHLTITQIGVGKFRVVLPDHLREGQLAFQD